MIPSAARMLWGKSGESPGHGLICHMLDVAAVAEAILSREPAGTLEWLSASFGLSSDLVAVYIAASAGLHDFGKAIPGFQCKWDTGMEQDKKVGLPFNALAQGVSRHDLASASLLRRFSARCPWLTTISLALGAHHGYMPAPTELKYAAPLQEGAAWKEARCALFDSYWQSFGLGDESAEPPQDLATLTWFAGLTSVSDWIGSNDAWFPHGERDETLQGHRKRARDLADVALDDIGWPVFRPLLRREAGTDELITDILGSTGTPVSARPLQSVADDLLLRRANGPTLLLVEAPMGEGKTELAFLSFLRLQALNGHRGLYVALPTQATGNAMFDRALTFLRAFSDDVQLDIQLVHGGAALDPRVHRLRGVGTSPGEEVSSSAWFSQRRRALLSPYGIGTIDQALFATLNVKHHFVRLWGLANRVVVLDEVHAYDTYTTGLIEALLRWLKALGCSVVLMSATLPARRRAAFLEAWDARGVPEVPYPRVLVACEGEVGAVHVECRSLAPVQVAGLEEDLIAVARSALAMVEGGGCGAVIVNTVQRAQTLYSLLQEDARRLEVDLLLFHARYPADERSKREKAVLDRFARHGGRPERSLLVATQVVEQSLDIDFDFMISDLAPVDLLLQRAGRLHRHERQRPPAHAVPRLFVAGLLAGRLPELEETAWGFVYAPYILYRTWALVAREPVWRLPEDIDRLVQAVYSQEPLPEEDEAAFVKAFERAFGTHIADTQEHRRRAQATIIDVADEPQYAYLQKPRADDDEGGIGFRAVTRLGEDSVTAVPVFVGADGWRLVRGGPTFDPGLTLDDALAHQIYRRQVRLSRKDVVLSLKAAQQPAGFSQHPLLRDMKALELKEDGAVLGSLRIRLDPELGIYL